MTIVLFVFSKRWLAGHRYEMVPRGHVDEVTRDDACLSESLLVRDQTNFVVRPAFDEVVGNLGQAFFGELAQILDVDDAVHLVAFPSLAVTGF